jgi:hypothetical protein
MQCEIDTQKQYDVICNLFGYKDMAGKIIVDDTSLFNCLAKSKAFIAGGAISSLFTNRTVNDWDVFFLNENYKNHVKTHMMNAGWENIVTTNLADTLKGDIVESEYGAKIRKGEVIVQLVTAYYGTPLDIFETFDFHCCMGAFDFNSHEFVFDERFCTDNLTRILRYNYEGTSNPVNTMFRIDKYKEYGYSISVQEMIKISMAIHRLKLDTYGDAQKFIKSIPNPHVKKILLKHLFDVPLANISFNTEEGRQKYKKHMEKKFDTQDMIHILNDLSYFTKGYVKGIEPNADNTMLPFNTIKAPKIVLNDGLDDISFT